MLLKKVNKLLYGVLNTQESRLKHDTSIPTKLNELPNQQTREMEPNKKPTTHIRDTYNLWEGPLPISRKFTKMEDHKTQKLESILENLGEKEPCTNQETKQNPTQPPKAQLQPKNFRKDNREKKNSTKKRRIQQKTLGEHSMKEEQIIRVCTFDSTLQIGMQKQFSPRLELFELSRRKKCEFKHQ